MNKVARMTKRDRADLFAETAERRDLSEAVVEKDFWVCWTLKQLFAIDALRDRLLFKGGTSLSKINHAINRFSEDIDLAVDYVALGFTGDRDPRREGLSKTKRAAILAEMMTACQQYIGSEFLEVLRGRCEEILGNGEDWTLAVSEQDRNIVRFQYPSAAPTLDYIKPQVILELGTHAEFVPRDRFTVRAFAAEEFPSMFAEPDVAVTSLLAKRTFWEKATILHAEAHRPADKAIPERFSRHYADLAALAQHAAGPEALARDDLRARVVEHKQVFFPAAWANYETAVPGTLKLIPSDQRLTALEGDYRAMQEMFFRSPPTWSEIVSVLKALEARINSTSAQT